jgi:hypothetical protein
MALITVTNDIFDNLPPSAIGDNTINVAYTATHVFTAANFTTETSPAFSDPEGDSVLNLKIVTVPTLGTIELSAVTQIAGDIVPWADVVAGNLTYVQDVQTTAYNDSDMTFDLMDDGSNQYSGLTPGIITYVVAGYINLPPNNVGDETLNLTWNEHYIFTRADFTTNTTPPYSDPEADAEQNLKILSVMPSVEGFLKYNGTQVIVNQVISFVDIDAGLLEYSPLPINTGGLLTNFTFAISDVGSGNYSS